MKKMKWIFLFFTFLFSACSSIEQTIEDNLQVNNESLRIFVANSLEDIDVPLPISLYVFNAAEECVDVKTLETAEDAFEFTLPLGSHKLYVISGASPDTYSLPDKDEATPDFPITLKTAGKLHTELAAKSKDVVITGKGVSDLTITVDRIIAQVTAAISDVPDNVTDVSVTLEPLEEEVLLNGTYGGDGKDRVTFNLVNTDDGLWETNEPLFVLPGAANVSVTITLTDDNGSHPFAYTALIPVRANSKTDITAVYKAGSAELSGKIQCSDWANEYEVSFEFGEGADNSEGNEMLTQGDIYKGCYILDVLSETPEKSIFLLMAPQALNNKLKSEVSDYRTITHAGITDWRLLSIEEAEILHQLYSKDIASFNNILQDAGIDPLIPDGKYIFIKKELEYFILNATTFNSIPTNVTDKYNIRVVTTVEVEW